MGKPETSKCAIISIVIEGNDLEKLNLDAVAERIHRVVNGEAVPSVDASEFRSCDGINLFDRVCIGSSK